VKDYFSESIVTELSEAKEFHIADREHQDYYNENSDNGYCRVVIDPKLAKLRAMYSDILA
jgi:peptide methionine sulfoxide reductase MsrA